MWKQSGMKVLKDELCICQLLLAVVCLSLNQVHGQSADVIFVVDTSSSNEASDIAFNRTTTLIQDIANVFEIGQEPGQTRIGALTFSGEDVGVGFRLNSCNSMEDLQFMVSTIRQPIAPRRKIHALVKVLDNMFESRNGGRDGVARVAVVIAYEGGSGNFSSVVKTALKSLEKDVVVIVVNVGEAEESTELQEAASSSELYFQLNVSDIETLTMAKTKMIRNIIEVCSRHYVDVTVAYDNNPLSEQDSLDRLQQLETITNKLQASDCHARLRVISGLGPESSSAQNLKGQGNRRPSVRAAIKKWRKKASRQRRASEGGPGRLPVSIPSNGQNKRLVLVLSKRHESEFRSIVGELGTVMSDGTKVLVVLDGTVRPNYVLAWQQVLGFSRVIVLKDTTHDISEDVEDFICTMDA
ncbi:VWA domain-containing protein 3 [Biomphalaria glabrata]|nr:VWA domain-containing protein 3; partial [Biomphalaria glabrata]